MAEENNVVEQKISSVELKGHDLTSSVDVVQNTMDKFLGNASVETVYGKPIKKGDYTIIPTSENITAMGFGSGFGAGGDAEGDAGGGGGGGGGGRVLSRPVAVVIASEDGVRVEPVVDPTKIVLAFFTTLGFMFASIMRMRRGNIEK